MTADILAGAVNFIGGSWVRSAGPAVESRNPADDGDTVGVVPDSTPDDVRHAVDVAVSAAPGWAATPAPVRGDVLRRWNQLIGEHAEELALLMTREMGKPLAESRAELGRARLELDYAAGEGTRLHGATIPSRAVGQLVYTELEPIGVVAAITPWNFPAVAPIRKIGPALVAGNSVVLKPALETSVTALRLAGLLAEAGQPEGVLGVVSGRGETVGAQLAADARVDGVSFTGSTVVGRTVNAAVARRLGRTQLELGGKNAAYVHSARDLDAVAAHITGAAIQTSGQRCTAISRVIVHDDLADALVERLAASWAELAVGSGLEPATQVGPLVSDAQYERVTGYLLRGEQEGARRCTPERPVPSGRYIAPTVLDGVTREMAVAREEIFGPVLSVLRVSGEEEAVAVANDCEYGLAAVVFSEDIGVAMRFARRVRAGMVHVNHGTVSQPHVPFGGVSGSGAGAFSIGFTNRDFFTQTKVVYLAPTP
jgi:alpha-ketoglutaric semialdehyde dehydrogenase